MPARLNFLIAEDDENDVLFLKRALKKAGVKNEPRVVHNGQEAMDYLSGKGSYSDRSTYPMPSAVLTDLKMPLKNGLDLLKWRKNHPQYTLVPAIVFTSSRVERDVKEAYQLGANGYVVKPAAPEELNLAVEAVVQFLLRCERPMPS